MTSDPYGLTTEFHGRLRDKSLRDGAADATLRVTPDALVAQVGDGTPVALPWRGMKVRRDEGGALICTAAGGRSVTCADPEFFRALETSGGNDLNDQLSRLEGLLVTSRGKHVLGCFSILAVVVLLFWGVPKLFRGAIEKGAQSIPYEVDETIGEKVQESMDPGGDVIEDELARAAIQEMIDRLRPYRDLPEAEFEFRIVRSEQVNAFALPGGYITVYTGLILESDDPAQVAGVIAHEMAHVTLRHGVERVANQMASYAALMALAGDAEGLARMAIEMFTLASVNEYGQDQESEADLEGVRMMLGARIDPMGLAEFFRVLEEKYGDVPDGVAWLSSHPQHAERVLAIRERIREEDGLPEWKPFTFDWDAVKASLED